MIFFGANGVFLVVVCLLLFGKIIYGGKYIKTHLCIEEEGREEKSFYVLSILYTCEARCLVIQPI